ncbi:MAG: AmmeMemoRadiSam system protein B [bacterium]
MGGRGIREPAVAGSFYPGDEKSLGAIVESLLASVRPGHLESTPVALLVPHAGYPYSGQTAAYAYRTIKGEKYDTVVLVGPSHYSYFEGVALYTGDLWRTPLGQVMLDDEITSRILESCPAAASMPSVHEEEHSLEVQLPFLQKVLRDFKIVPVVISFRSAGDAATLARSIVAACSGRSSLLVASSDLYHGSSYEECVRKTDATVRGIIQGDPERLQQSFASGESSACGEGAILTALSAAESLDASPVLLHQTNSGDVMGSRSGYVVGYCSFAFI